MRGLSLNGVIDVLLYIFIVVFFCTFFCTQIKNVKNQSTILFSKQCPKGLIITMINIKNKINNIINIIYYSINC
jgi:hypothetical protein